MLRALVGVFLIVALSVPTWANELSSLHWLAGTWKRDSSRGPIYERWVVLSDRTLEGHSWRAVDGERIDLESLLLVAMGEEIFYISKVLENPYPVPFRLTELEARHAAFENPEHDFPTKILYTRVGNDSLIVSIEGPGPGDETRRIDFPFVRLNDKDTH
ncbi:MAG: hypothetical protein JSW67_07950 [Candidatus Latescibacterota bacterium]|nr:MAG: hypothetical protein JSW67_07950 [Candidatus Latescibacterota bacterium]